MNNCEEGEVSSVTMNNHKEGEVSSVTMNNREEGEVHAFIAGHMSQSVTLRVAVHCHLHFNSFQMEN